MPGEGFTAMANFNESLTEKLDLSKRFEVDILTSVKVAIDRLSPDDRRALRTAIWNLRRASRPEGEQRSGATRVAGTADLSVSGFAITIPAEEARARIVQAVPKIEPLFPALEAKVPGITAGLAILALGLVLQPADKSSSEYALFRQTINSTTIVITSPPSASTTALSPLAQVVLGELRKVGGAVSRESVLAATPLAPQDIDRGLSELVQAGAVTEAPSGVFTPR